MTYFINVFKTPLSYRRERILNDENNWIIGDQIEHIVLLKKQELRFIQRYLRNRLALMNGADVDINRAFDC